VFLRARATIQINRKPHNIEMNNFPTRTTRAVQLGVYIYIRTHRVEYDWLGPSDVRGCLFFSRGDGSREKTKTKKRGLQSVRANNYIYIYMYTHMYVFVVGVTEATAATGITHPRNLDVAFVIKDIRGHPPGARVPKMFNYRYARDGRRRFVVPKTMINPARARAYYIIYYRRTAVS